MNQNIIKFNRFKDERIKETMKRDRLTSTFRSLSFPKQGLKTIKLKRFLKERRADLDFTQVDLFLSRIHDNYSGKRVTLNSFLELAQFLVENGMIEEEQLIGSGKSSLQKDEE